jgi:hypothetical protein
MIHPPHKAASESPDFAHDSIRTTERLRPTPYTSLDIECRAWPMMHRNPPLWSVSIAIAVDERPSTALRDKLLTKVQSGPTVGAKLIGALFLSCSSVAVAAKPFSGAVVLRQMTRRAM